MQRAQTQFFKPENYFEVRKALEQADRTDLIGSGCDALIHLAFLVAKRGAASEGQLAVVKAFLDRESLDAHPEVGVLVSGTKEVETHEWSALEAGVATFMTGFNALNGVPATGNRFLLRQILRDEWKFDGVTVSDYEAIPEMVRHGYALDARDAALKALRAGVDMEMVSTAYFDHLKSLIRNGQVAIVPLPAEPDVPVNVSSLIPSPPTRVTLFKPAPDICLRISPASGEYPP